ncbi:MAG: Crp/Fnr family transcriptional regulator [Bacteroidales bacterium]|nr:MAG: Crp/Fnr family transcriptional regulator [Bacteroidales bacterium]
MRQQKLDCDHCLNYKDSIFRILDDPEKNSLRQSSKCLYYNKGDTIFSEGDKAVGLLCLVKGIVKVFMEGNSGREQIIRLAKPVGFIGYKALFADENHNVSAIAIEDCTICRINKEGLFKVLRSNNELCLQIMKFFASELKLSNSRTVTLTQKHIRGRLAESLIFLKDTYGFEKNGKTLNICLTRGDIAHLSNMTTSNAIRTLSAFAKEEIIALNGKRIEIIDMGVLEHISEFG